MKSYKITKPREFGMVAASDTVCDANFAKVKILRAGVSSTDIALYRGGAAGVNYPLTPSHQAIGVISETSGDSEFIKSERVYLNPYIKCGACIPCLSGEPQKCENMKMFGIDADGFLADFVIVPVKNLCRVPDALDKDRAMFVEYTAFSKTALDKLKIQKGEHVVITGAGKLGNILAQLTIYYQGVPVVIDENEDMLARAREAGVYYTINPKAQDVKKAVREITGNRMAENVVHISNPAAAIDESMDLAGCNGEIVVMGGEKELLQGSLSKMVKKQLRLSGVNNGSDNILSAINLLANKTINIANLMKENISFDAVPEKFKEWAEEDDFCLQATVDC